jgi:hypothetical protein
MALKPCKECKTEVSSSAKKCPHCGVDNPTLTNRQALGGCLVLLLIIGGCWIAVSSGGGGPSSSPPELVTLDALVQRSATQIVVTNQGEERWTNCRVEINPGIVRGGWSQSVAVIEPGQRVEGGLFAFTRSGGERFNPGTHVVESVTVQCDTPAGRGFYRGTF